MYHTIVVMDNWINDECYRFIFDNSLDAAMLISTDGKIFKANQAACEMFEYTEPEICKLGRDGIVDANDPHLKAVWEELLREGRVRAELTFIRKDSSRFPVAVTSAIFQDDKDQPWAFLVARDITENKQTESDLRKAKEDAMHFVSYDYLTDILNRKTFISRLQQEMNRTKREELALSLLMLEIDYFKSINDRLGRDAGHAILQAFDMTIARNLRPYDFCGRYDGNKFIVCLPHATNRQAFNVAERLRKRVEGEHYAYQDNILHLTVSIGISSYDWDSFMIPSSSLIALADQNMYKAKKKHNCVYGLDTEVK